MDFRSWVSSVGGAKAAAELIGCSPVAVRKYISGERRPRPELAEKIEDVSDGQISRVSWYWPTQAA